MNADTNDNNNAGENVTGGANGADHGAGNELDSGLDSALDAEARLLAADPAAGLEPGAGFVDDVLTRTVNAPASGAAAAAEAAPVHDLAAERARRRPRWLPIAAVAASIAIVGGAGFGLGASATSNLAGGSANSAGNAAPPISMPSGPGGGARPELGGQQDGSSAMAGGTPGMASGKVSDMMYPGGFGRNNFSASGLSTASGTAAAYGYDARSASNAENIGELAAALGVEGTPELRDGGWWVGVQDGTVPTLWVSIDGTLGFGYYDPRLDPWKCTMDADPCDPPADLPSADAAIEALRGIIAASGRDAGAFEYGSETWDGAFTRTAQAWPVLDGRRIEQAWNLELTSAGVYSAGGALADTVPLGDYAVVSEQEGFERLSDPRFGAQMTAMPNVLRESATADGTEWTPPTEPPATPSAGTALSWPVNDVEIVSARLGLGSQWQPDGSVLIVPAYEFTDAAGGTWSVMAVADSMLNFAGN